MHTSCLSYSATLPEFFFTASLGVSDFELVATSYVDGIMLGYCNSTRKTAEPREDWVKKMLENETDLLNLNQYTQRCFESYGLKARIDSFKQLFGQSGGVHILQRISGCEWDNETGEINGFNHYGYDGEDIISFDLKTLTWIAVNPEAVTIKERWDADKSRITYNQQFLIEICPQWLKMCLAYGRSSLLRTELPSVSLLQKTPSSPVSCHATGFYPDRVTMFWRKDGEELHEDVDLGEILPNNDGSFQRSVDLNLSSATPEDWRRYDCVFHLSGVKDDIVTKLDKTKIRTNWGKTLFSNDKDESSNITIPITATVVVLAVVLIAVIGFTAYKKKKAPVNSSELSERLNPETTQHPAP
ncbi:major histocompatibility complex class I-related gene protein-like [Micropterus salmoides]|uniref:major histocompatibility complex class I-related gene protein-like n=1 Tax=Micropterus salmoides TaxID=27706 RepID=UPI0018EA60AC|nr:major histocompatibility complex class I-related gene protein-like [Micropterus salmoides]